MDEVRARQRSEALASAIYGQILITAIVAALSEDPDAATGYLLLSAVTTILIFWVAHIYARGMARGITLGRSAEWGELREFMATERPMLTAAIPTVFILVLGTLGVFSRNTPSASRSAPGWRCCSCGGSCSAATPARRGRRRSSARRSPAAWV